MYPQVEHTLTASESFGMNLNSQCTKFAPLLKIPLPVYSPPQLGHFNFISVFSIISRLSPQEVQDSESSVFLKPHSGQYILTT